MTAPQGFSESSDPEQGITDPKIAIDGVAGVCSVKLEADATKSLFTATIPLSLVDSIGFFGVC